MAEVLEDGVISQTRFLIVDGDRATLDKMERYLLLQAAAKVYTAPSPLLALRIMQDRRTPVDCVICPNKQGRISGLEFLQNLRLGRWSGPHLRNVKFILVMQQKDDAAIQIADGFRVNGYIIGELDRTTVTDAVVKALTQDEADSPLKKYPVAHLRFGGVDALIVPFEKGFGAKSPEEQQHAINALQAAASALNLGGAVVPVWETEDGRTGFVARAEDHSVFSGLTMEYVRLNLNRELSVGEEIPRSEAEENEDSSDASLSPFMVGERGNQPASDAGDGDAGMISASAKAAKGTSAGEGRSGVGTKEKLGVRAMTYEDVGKVILAFKQLGPENFVKAFLRNQRVIGKPPGKPIVLFEREYFFSLDLLRKALFPDVNLRKSGHMFGDLTLALDQTIMRSIAQVPNLDEPFSLNLNVQSVFTKTFEGFLATAPLELLTIEFRQPNIVEFYDEFVTARALLESKGVKIAVDGIFPDTLGLVNLEYLGARMAKVQWADGCEEVLAQRAFALKRFAEAGVLMVMTRIEQSSALVTASKVGIERFQGFLVDDLLKKNAA